MVGMAGLIAYANTAGNAFVWDDVSSVLLHKHVQDPAQFLQLFREDQHAFGRGQGNFYRPLVAASFMADFTASRTAPPPKVSRSPIPNVSPFVFHVTNLCWHLLAALLLFALLARLKAPRLVQMAVPLIYVVHPLHTEAVTYISGRADPMAAVFLYAALWCTTLDSTTGQRIAGVLLMALSFCCGLLSKESSTIFPFLLLWFVLARPRENNEPHKVYMVRLVPFAVSVVILAVYALLRMTVLRFAPPGAGPSTSFGQRLVETGQAFATYIKLIGLPTRLHMERSLEGASGWTAIAGFLLLGACVALLVESWLHRRRRTTLALGWFLITWFPISGLIPLNAPMAEHWMYVPLAGFLWALAEAIAPLAHRRLGRGLAMGTGWAACVALTVLTVARNRDWRDNETIFLDTLEKNPKSIRVHYNLAATYEDLLKNQPGARRHYEAVLALYKDQKKRTVKTGEKEPLWEDELESHFSLGRIFSEQHQYAAAAQHYAAILSLAPDDPHKELVASAALGLGKCYLATGDVRRAGELFRKAVALYPPLKEEMERDLSAGMT